MAPLLLAGLLSAVAASKNTAKLTFAFGEDGTYVLSRGGSALMESVRL